VPPLLGRRRIGQGAFVARLAAAARRRPRRRAHLAGRARGAAPIAWSRVGLVHARLERH
jgi:hypothetical protein